MRTQVHSIIKVHVIDINKEYTLRQLKVRNTPTQPTNNHQNSNNGMLLSFKLSEGLIISMGNDSFIRKQKSLLAFPIISKW